MSRKSQAKVSGSTLIQQVHHLRQKGCDKIAVDLSSQKKVEYILWQAETRLLKVTVVGHGTTEDLKFLDGLMLELETLSDPQPKSSTI